MSLLGQRIIYVEIDGVSQYMEVENSDDDTLDHLWCECKGPDIGLCGSDLSDSIDLDKGVLIDLCVVCSDLDKTHDTVCAWGGGL